MVIFLLESFFRAFTVGNSQILFIYPQVFTKEEEPALDKMKCVKCDTNMYLNLNMRICIQQ